MKTLYLDGGTPMEVRLDGPSLEVFLRGRAPARYPLARVLRVVVSGEVEWRTEALLACLEEGIPVVFLRADGSVRGECLAQKARGAEQRHLIEDFLERSDWEGQYRCWRKAAERRAILGALRGMNLWARDLRPRSVEEQLRGALSERAEAGVVEGVLSYLGGLLEAQVASTLLVAGLPPLLIRGRRERWRLGEDLARVLSWQQRADFGKWLEQGSVRGERWDRETKKGVTAQFESLKERETNRTRVLLDRFLYWLGGLR